MSLFPTADVIREGHICIPFAHWFPRDSLLRYIYTLSLRTIGMGNFKENRSIKEWVHQKLDWLDRYTYYRSRREVESIFGRYFRNRGIERHYIKFRFSEARWPRRLRPMLLQVAESSLTRLFYHRLFGVALLSTKHMLPAVEFSRPPSGQTIYY